MLSIQNGGFLISLSRCTEKSLCLCTKTLVRIQLVRPLYPPVCTSDHRLTILSRVHVGFSVARPSLPRTTNQSLNKPAPIIRILASSSSSLIIYPHCLACPRNSRLSGPSSSSERSLRLSAKSPMLGARNAGCGFSPSTRVCFCSVFCISR